MDSRGKDCRGKSKWRREDWRGKTVKTGENIEFASKSELYMRARSERERERERGGRGVGGWWISTMIEWLKQLRKSFGFSFLWLICLIYFTQVGFSILPLSSFASFFIYVCVWIWFCRWVSCSWELKLVGCWVLRVSGFRILHLRIC